MVQKSEKIFYLFLCWLSISALGVGVLVASWSFNPKFVGEMGPAAHPLFGLSPENTNFLFRALPLCVGFSMIWFAFRTFIKSVFRFLELQFPGLKQTLTFRFPWS